MANTFRQRKEEEVQPQRQQRKQSQRQPQNQPRPKAKSPRASERPAAERPAAERPAQKKSIGKVMKAIHKGFETVFGGGFLQKINIRKNWGFILMLVVMIIVLIYSNLRIQSKRELINKLIKEVIVAKDGAMDAIEEGYTIDKQKEREILQEGEERGFNNSGYIPYIIETNEKSKNE